MLWSFKSLLLQRHVPVGSSEAYVFATICVAIASLLRWALIWIAHPDLCISDVLSCGFFCRFNWRIRSGRICCYSWRVHWLVGVHSSAL